MGAKKLFLFSFLVLFAGSFPQTLHAGDKNWQPATLISAERHDDQGDLEQHKHTDVSTDGNGNYSADSTTTVGNSNLHYNWMYYTISTPKRDYVVRQMVNLPWVKTIKAEAGDTIQYAVDGKKLYVRNEDGSEVKTDIIKATAHIATAAPNQP